VTVAAGARQQPGRPLISEEERKAQAARRHALSQARDAARQLSLGLRHLHGGDPDTKSNFTMEAEGRLGNLPRHGTVSALPASSSCQKSAVPIAKRNTRQHQRKPLIWPGLLWIGFQATAKRAGGVSGSI
jgi:hypothetical protein